MVRGTASNVGRTHTHTFIRRASTHGSVPVRVCVCLFVSECVQHSTEALRRWIQQSILQFSAGMLSRAHKDKGRSRVPKGHRDSHVVKRALVMLAVRRTNLLKLRSVPGFARRQEGSGDVGSPKNQPSQFEKRASNTTSPRTPMQAAAADRMYREAWVKTAGRSPVEGGSQEACLR